MLVLTPTIGEFSLRLMKEDSVKNMEIEAADSVIFVLTICLRIA